MMQITNSEAQTYRRCPRKWKYIYEDMTIPRQPIEPFYFGSAIGLGLDAIWERREDFISETLQYLKDYGEEHKLRLLSIQATAMLEGYKALYGPTLDNWELVAVEKLVSWEIAPGVEYRGALDKVIRHKETKQLYVLDHKTTASDVDIQSEFWIEKALDPQLVGYKLALEQEMGEHVDMIYDVIRKHKTLGPHKKKQIRQKKDETDMEFAARTMENMETWEEYEARVKDDYLTKPEKYFNVMPVFKQQDEIDQWQPTMVFHAKSIENSLEADIYPKVTSNCGRDKWACEYRDVCLGYMSLDDNKFKKKKNAHPELDGDNDKEGADDGII